MNTMPVRKTSAIEPFWLRLGKITAYPLQASALISIAAYAALRLIASFLPWLASIVLAVIALAALYRFASQVLVNTAHGRMTAPEGWAQSEDNVGYTQLRLQVALMAMGLLAVLLFGPVIGLIVAIVIAFAAPGATMSIATDGDLWLALNPATWFAIMGRLGWPYFVVAVLCGVVLVSQANAQAFLFPFLPPTVGLFVAFLIGHYATVVNFHLMGYLIYQYHDELGWTPEGDDAIRRTADPDQDVLDAAEGFAADGKLDQAEALLKDQLGSRGGSPAVHDRYRKLLALRGANDALLAHGRDYINVLLAQNADRKALDVIRECLAIEKGFQPTDATFVNRLAQRAADLGMAQLALDILSGFHKAFPRHVDTPKNYLLAAKLMAEKMNAEDKALALLSQVSKAFPTHPMLPEIESYVKFLEALMAPRKQPA
jgi:hypothetical protein